MTEFSLGALRDLPKAITRYKKVAARDILAAKRGGWTRYICTAYRAARFQSAPRASRSAFTGRGSKPALFGQSPGMPRRAMQVRKVYMCINSSA
jgi:hypothetical protein